MWSWTRHEPATRSQRSRCPTDGALEELAAKGIEPAIIEQPGPTARKATMFDPDGNTVAVIEVRDGGS